MNAAEANLVKFPQTSPEFGVPICRRNGPRTADDRRWLRGGRLHVGSDDENVGHFIGSIFDVEPALASVTTKEGVLVINDQQRVMTPTLLLAALADGGAPKLRDSFSARTVRTHHLVNPNGHCRGHRNRGPST